MPINAKKVLILRNSNAGFSALSTGVSDWYATARGLTDVGGAADYFWMSFDFGNHATSNLLTRLAADYLGIANPAYSNAVWTTGNGLTNIVIDAVSPLTCAAHSAKITASQVGVGFVPAIAAVVAAHGIEAILVTPGCPNGVQGPFSGGAGVYFSQGLEVYAALAPLFNNLSAGSFQRNWFHKPTVGNGLMAGRLFSDGTTSGSARRASSFPLAGRFTEATFPAWGRIGWVAADRSAFSTLAEVQTIVNNAIANEATNNLSKLHVVGGTAYAFGGHVYAQTAANEVAFEAGVNLHHVKYVPGIEFQVGYVEWVATAFPPPQGWKGTASVEPFTTGSGIGIRADGGGQLSAWAVNVARVAQYRTEAANVAGLTFQPGGWAYSWMSEASGMREFSIRSGASLAIGVIGEPFAQTLCDSDVLLKNLLAGMSGCEAIYKGAADIQSATFLPGESDDIISNQLGYSDSAWGDPLYRPYAASQPKLMQGI